MRLRSALTLSLLLACAIGLAGCQRRYEWRQKLTVIVETPEGEKSGSSVTEVVALFGQVPASASEVDYKFTGEATVVEVSPGRYLFALLNGSEERFYRAARERFQGMHRRRWLAEIPKQTAPVVLTDQSIPMLVTFGDISDPTSVREVKPNDLAVHFGPGYRLKSLTLEITEEPVIKGRALKVLPWLPNVWPNQLDGQKYETAKAVNRFANSLSTGNFYTEVWQ